MHPGGENLVVGVRRGVAGELKRHLVTVSRKRWKVVEAIYDLLHVSTEISFVLDCTYLDAICELDQVLHTTGLARDMLPCLVKLENAS
jgi:hypothetical protein